jgi:hypothetical protein
MLLTLVVIFIIGLGLAKLFRLPWWSAFVGAAYFGLRRWGLGVFGEIDIWWLILGVVTLPWWLGPPVVKATQKMSAKPVFTPFDPKDPVPSDLATAIEDMTVALEREGFRPVGDFVQVGAAPNVRTRVVLLEEPSTGDLAVSVAMYTTGEQARVATSYVEFLAKFADGRLLLANNTGQVSPVPSPQGKTVLRLPQVRDPVRLLRLFRAYLEREYRGAARERASLQDPAGFLAEAMVRELDGHVAVGYSRLDQKAELYRLTWKGAVLMTWQLLPPASWVLKRRLRRRGEALARELDAGGADARPVAEARSSNWMAWQAAVVVAAFAAFFFFGDHVRSFVARADAATRTTRRTALPEGFSVPADFPGAVRALETLAAAPASPVAGRDSLDEAVPTPGFEVAVPAKRAESVLAAAAPLFAGRGFLLIRHDQTFGIGGEPEQLALFPSRDPYEVMALLGTNGANYEIGTGKIIAWLHALDEDHPFVITGIGYDHVEGRFYERPNPDEARALADRFYDFCPDIVDQGTGTTVALAAEIARTGRLYCWWD